MNLPILGVAGGLKDFQVIKDWIFEKDRALEIQDFVPSATLGAMHEDLISDYKSFLADHNGLVGIHGPFINLDIAAIDKEISAVTTKRLLQGLDVCEKLGGTHMVVHSPFSAWLSINELNMPSIKRDMFASSQDVLGPVIKRCEEIGCIMVLENIDDTDPFIRKELVETFDTDHFKLSIDTGHAQLSHCNNNAPAVVDFIIAAGELLSHVHLQDVDGYADRHWHPLEGIIPWGPVFNELSKIETSPRLILEPKDRYSLLPTSVERLEEAKLAQ
ncbi:MAG: sugar phosphate isomerase/epimerase family protein [Lentilitoribacter sp.]